MTTPCDKYTWNHRELGGLRTLSESSAEGGIEPRTIRSMRKNSSTGSYPYKNDLVQKTWDQHWIFDILQNMPMFGKDC